MKSFFKFQNIVVLEKNNTKINIQNSRNKIIFIDFNKKKSKLNKKI